MGSIPEDPTRTVDLTGSADETGHAATVAAALLTAFDPVANPFAYTEGAGVGVFSRDRSGDGGEQSDHQVANDLHFNFLSG